MPPLSVSPLPCSWSYRGTRSYATIKSYIRVVAKEPPGPARGRAELNEAFQEQNVNDFIAKHNFGLGVAAFAVPEAGHLITGFAWQAEVKRPSRDVCRGTAHFRNSIRPGPGWLPPDVCP